MFHFLKDDQTNINTMLLLPLAIELTNRSGDTVPVVSVLTCEANKN